MIILIIILIFLFYILKINYNYKETFESEKKQPIEYTCPGPIELPCRQGPPGEQGPSGGTYLRNGPLRNLGQTDMVVDRMFNSGPASVGYLSNQNYKPQQTWMLHASSGKMANKLENQYGGCLTMDNQNTVYMDKCTDATEWIFTAQGNLKPKSDTSENVGESKCLSFSNEGAIKNVAKTGLINTMGKNINPYTNLLQLKMAPCDTKADNQQWAFY